MEHSNQGSHLDLVARVPALAHGAALLVHHMTVETRQGTVEGGAGTHRLAVRLPWLAQPGPRQLVPLGVDAPTCQCSGVALDGGEAARSQALGSGKEGTFVKCK